MVWEYKKVVTQGLISERDLNILGAEGWQHYHTTGNVHLFKRSVNNTPSMVAPPIKNDMVEVPQTQRNGVKGRK